MERALGGSINPALGWTNGGLGCIVGSFASLDKVGSAVFSARTIFKNEPYSLLCWYPELVILIHKMGS